MVIVHAFAQVFFGLIDNFVFRQVYLQDFFGATEDLWQHLAQRRDDIQGTHRGTDRFRQQRAEDKMIFAIKQNNLGLVGLLLAPLAVGAVPVLVEIDESLTMDATDLRAKICQSNGLIVLGSSNGIQTELSTGAAATLG